MADWSDWYANEDPTKWVLAEILKKRATETPDREYLKFADNPWVSYGEVNARANRVANALIARFFKISARTHVVGSSLAYQSLQSAIVVSLPLDASTGAPPPRRRRTWAG